MDVRETQAALAVLVVCSSVAMEVVVVGSASPAAAEELSPTPAAENTPTAEAAQAEGDPLALYDDNGNGRITCAKARTARDYASAQRSSSVRVYAGWGRGGV